MGGKNSVLMVVDLLGSLRARFDLSQGPSTPSRIAVQFTCDGATISRLNFELKSQEYKLSLVKKRVSTGKFEFDVFSWNFEGSFDPSFLP